ncbi:MAG: LLM class flavin-dependent oxidoreductase [Pseudomonadales bacterium]|nr:LLM class flavin-dependent oxidoreductase [Pseudomonadales bacterium]
MKQGLCSLGDHRADPTTGQRSTQVERHAQILQYLDMAEPLGFDTVVAGEHHFSDFIMSVPQLFLARLAGRTEKLRLATGVTLLPHHDPVRIAEDFATLDVLSQGRAEVWVGKGVEPKVYDHFGQSPKEAMARQLEGLELLTKLWTERELDWCGEYRSPLESVTLEPRPIQTPHPPIYISCSNPDATELPAKLGLNLVMTGLAFDLAQLRPMIERYREAWVKAGHSHQGKVTLLAHVYVGKTTEAAIKHLEQYQFTFQKWVFAKRFALQPDEVSLPSRITNLGSDECVIAVGNAQAVIDKVSQLCELSDCDRFIVQCDYGGQPWPLVREGLERYAADVLPTIAKL